MGYSPPRDETVLEATGFTLSTARSLHADMRSVHEALGVIREEYLEAEREAFTRTVNECQLRTELMQLAAMCVRAIVDLGLGD